MVRSPSSAVGFVLGKCTGMSSLWFVEGTPLETLLAFPCRPQLPFTHAPLYNSLSGDFLSSLESPLWPITYYHRLGWWAKWGPFWVNKRRWGNYAWLSRGFQVEGEDHHVIVIIILFGDSKWPKRALSFAQVWAFIFYVIRDLWWHWLHKKFNLSLI